MPQASCCLPLHLAQPCPLPLNLHASLPCLLQAQFESFVYPSRDDSHVLRVINVALTSATPCVKVFPAVVALAKVRSNERVPFSRPLLERLLCRPCPPAEYKP